MIGFANSVQLIAMLTAGLWLTWAIFLRAPASSEVATGRVPASVRLSGAAVATFVAVSALLSTVAGLEG